jgi:NADH dehydrogenase
MNNYQNQNYKKIVTIFGGSGFVGSALIKELIKHNFVINIPTSDVLKTSKLKTYSTPGKINVFYLDIKDDKQIENSIKGSDFVINLIASFDDSEIQNFQYIHAQLPEKIAKFCSEQKVQRFIQMSNLGIENGSTIFAKTRLLGESASLKAFEKSIILRSGLIVGEDDSFLRILIILMNKFRFIPLIKNSQKEIKIQPIYVSDFAKAIIWLIENESVEKNQNLYKIAGPEIFNLKEACQMIKSHAKNKVFILEFNSDLLKIIAKLTNFKVFNFFHSIIFGIKKSPLSSEKISAINFNSTIERDEQNLVFKAVKEPLKLNSIIKKIFNFLYN